MIYCKQVIKVTAAGLSWLGLKAAHFALGDLLPLLRGQSPHEISLDISKQKKIGDSGSISILRLGPSLPCFRIPHLVIINPTIEDARLYNRMLKEYMHLPAAETRHSYLLLDTLTGTNNLVVANGREALNTHKLLSLNFHKLMRDIQGNTQLIRLIHTILQVDISQVGDSLYDDMKTMFQFHIFNVFSQALWGLPFDYEMIELFRAIDDFTFSESFYFMMPTRLAKLSPTIRQLRGRIQATFQRYLNENWQTVLDNIEQENLLTDAIREVEPNIEKLKAYTQAQTDKLSEHPKIRGVFSLLFPVNNLADSFFSTFIALGSAIRNDSTHYFDLPSLILAHAHTDLFSERDIQIALSAYYHRHLDIYSAIGAIPRYTRHEIELWGQKIPAGSNIIFPIKQYKTAAHARPSHSTSDHFLECTELLVIYQEKFEPNRLPNNLLASEEHWLVVTQNSFYYKPPGRRSEVLTLEVAQTQAIKKFRASFEDSDDIFTGQLLLQDLHDLPIELLTVILRITPIQFRRNLKDIASKPFGFGPRACPAMKTTLELWCRLGRKALKENPAKVQNDQWQDEKKAQAPTQTAPGTSCTPFLFYGPMQPSDRQTSATTARRVAPKDTTDSPLNSTVALSKVFN